MGFDFSDVEVELFENDMLDVELELTLEDLEIL